jgi:protein arginine N-methyltransferase 7
LRAGAFHVTAVERWLYLASSCKEALLANGRNDDEVKVVYKRPSDLALLEDVPIVCNLLIADVLEDGLLGCGIIPAVSHALANSLLTHDVRMIPASATVYMQVGQQQVPTMT